MPDGAHRRQPYFIVVVAHSVHGRLRRVHIPQHYVHAVLVLAFIGVLTVLGFIGTYVRMVWKVADYNSLRAQIELLRERYQALAREAEQKEEQLASLQLFAREISLTYGVRQDALDASGDVLSDPSLVPTFHETLEEYNFLKSAKFSVFSRRNPPPWHTNTLPTLWPVAGRLTSYFGKRTDPFTGEGAFHTGVDIPAPEGTPVRAAGDGVVVVAEWVGRYGRLVVINHGSGISTYYGHLSRVDVIPGQEVRQGEIIGTVGRTGRATSPHLHYEVRQGGSPVNPYIFLRRANRLPRLARRDLPF